MANHPKGNDHSSTSKQPITVATKTHDGGSNPPIERPRRQHVSKQEDPFLYYSDQETRINALLLNGNESDERATQESDIRQTRISFEIHPDLLLEDLIQDDVQRLPLDAVDNNRDGVIEHLQRLFFNEIIMKV
ncbi:hypothetical protein ACHAWT_000105 [Skeletonema menzelii]|eukprot:scaffold5829_cov128-Skeletonema_menzelii.AAC.2